MDSNGNATITGGSIVVNGPTDSGNGALDVNGTFTISGGTLLAVGSSGMAVAPDASSAQGWVAATFSSAQQEGTVVHIAAADGTKIASFTASKSFSSVVYSSGRITSGATYSVYTGESIGAGTLVGTFTAGTGTDRRDDGWRRDRAAALPRLAAVPAADPSGEAPGAQPAQSCLSSDDDVGGAAEPVSHHSGQALGRPPGLHQQSVAGRPAFRPTNP